MKYPLAQLTLIKKRRMEEAERFLQECKLKLEKEQKELKRVEKERDKTLKHKDDKETQLNDELSEGTTADKIRAAERYIKVVDEELQKKQKKVDDQKSVVKKAENALEAARSDLLKKQQDVEKMKLHRKEWDKEMRKIEKQQEGIVTDELGSAMHTLRKKRDKSE